LDAANGAKAMKIPVTIPMDAKRIFINRYFLRSDIRENGAIISKEAGPSSKFFSEIVF